MNAVEIETTAVAPLLVERPQINWFPTSLRLIACLAVSLGVAFWIQTPVAKAVLPDLRIWLATIDSRFRTVDLTVAKQGIDAVFQWVVTINASFEVAGNPVEPDPRGLATTALRIEFLLQPAAIALGLIAGWPSRSAREMLRRLLWAVPSLAVVALLDVPLVLLAGIWALVVNAFDPTGTYTLLLWSRFLQNGGRPLLGLLVGALSIWLGSMRRAPRSTASA